jgi:hypothetical protein
MVNIFYKINIFVFFKILFSDNKSFLFTGRKNILALILKNIKNNFFIIIFCTSSIQIKNQNIKFFSEKIVKNFIDEIIKTVPSINKVIKHETNLLISNYLHSQLNSIILKIELANYMIPKYKKFFFFKVSDYYVKKYLEKTYSCKISKNFFFYEIYDHLNIISKIYLFSLMRIFFSFFKKKNQKVKKKYILINSENPLNLEDTTRNDFFFLKKKQPKIFIENNFKNKNSKEKLISKNFKFLSKRECYYFKDDNLTLNKIKVLFINRINKDFFTNNFFGLYIRFLEIDYLMQKHYPIFLNFNIRHIINSSYSNNLTISFELMRQIFNYKTISYQYSFLKKPNPAMSTVSSYMFIFSSFFKKMFVNKYSKPQKIIESGYLYNSFIQKNKKLFIFLKKKYSLKDKFIISFFDENNEKSPWALKTKDETLLEYNKLANFVIKNKDIVIIIKNQFLRNIPSILSESKNENIKNAIKSGRFIELYDKEADRLIKSEINLFGHRNNIFPFVAAMLSDISISIKYGATTSIESAMVYNRNVLLNDKGYQTSFDSYLKKNIEFSNLDIILSKILSFKKSKSQNKKNNLGDWRPIMGKVLKFKMYKNSKFKNEIQKILI